MDFLVVPGKALTLSQCYSIIEERKASGLSVDEWCRANNVPKARYYNASKRIKHINDHNLKDDGIVSFSKVVNVTSPVAASGSVSITLSNAVIEIKDGTSLAMMEAVFKALKITC